MEKQIAYVLIEEYPDEEEKYIFHYNLKRCDSRHRLFKFRKTDIAEWYTEIPAIIRKELSADVHTLVYCGSPKKLRLLEQLEQPEKLHVISAGDLDRQEMLEVLAGQGNQQAISRLREDASGAEEEAFSLEEAESLEEADSPHQAELPQEERDSLTASDRAVLNLLREMDEEQYALRFPNAGVEVLASCIDNFLLQTEEDTAPLKQASAYIVKISNPISAYKYIGVVLFSDEENHFMDSAEGRPLGFQFMSLCLSEMFELAIEERGCVIQRFALEEE